MFINLIHKLFLISVATSLLVACGAGETRKLTKEEIIYKPRDKEKMRQMKEGGTFLSDLFIGDNDDSGSFSASSTKGPLWKASLDVLSSFPLANIDAKSGLIITDWYTSEKKPSERFKITVLLLSQEIRVDSVKVSVHKQIIKKNRWINKNIDDKKTLAIERRIIQRAIELNL